MAEIKDKVITAESLLALHEHNKETYVSKTDIVSIDKGGTGANTAATARTNLGITPTNIGAEPSFDILSIAKGGTNASDAATARTNLGITPANIGAEPSISILPITKGGTNASNGADGLKNLFAAGATVLSSNQYGDELPTAGTAGRIFFKRLVE